MMCARKPTLENSSPPIPDGKHARQPECTAALWLYFNMGLRYEQRVQHLRQKETQIAVETARPEKKKAPRVADPEKFWGNRYDFEIFTSQLALKFASDPTTFTDDNSRINYAALLLQDRAYDWLQPHINKTTGSIDFNIYEEFINALGEAFADPDAQATAERALRNLRQGTLSCASYYSRFVTIASKLKWNEEAKIYTFRAGLRDELKDLLVGKTEVPTERLSTFANYMITLDNSWQARQMEKKMGRPDNFRFRHNAPTTRSQQSTSQNTQNQFSGNRSTTKDGHYPRAMELDGAQKGKKITDAQRNYRRANNLCMYCGKSGHFASNCNAN